MKKSTIALITVGGVALAGTAGYLLLSDDKPKNKLPKAPRPPRTDGEPQESEDGSKTRRWLNPSPDDALWSDLAQSTALLSPNAQWRFALPEGSANEWPAGTSVTMRVDSVDGIVSAETISTAAGFNLISRLGPSVSLNRDTGVLQIYTGDYSGRVDLSAGKFELSAWVLSSEAFETKAKSGLSRHIIDKRVDGVWQAMAYAIADDGSFIASDSGEFLTKDEAVAWADQWLDEQIGAAVA